jgi:hypothetical protein
VPDLKQRMIFISHAWQYHSDYWTLVNWFDNEPNFAWSNCSVPSHDGLPDKTVTGLKQGLSRQIAPAHVVIFIAGMYAAHSDWIDYEVSEAVRMNKKIVGIKPWGQLRVPQNVQDAADMMVGWNSATVVSAVRELV